MDATEAHNHALAELQAGMDLVKCRKCGCMREVLETLNALPSAGDATTHELAAKATAWLGQMAPVRYACLGCAHCFPSVALNALADSQVIGTAGLTCALEATERGPGGGGKYEVDRTARHCTVAVSTLASTELADELARRQPAGLCIVGKTETENVGVANIVKYVVANPNVHQLILAGRDPDGHRSGQTLVALVQNGVDERMRVIGSVGKRPILRNVTRDEVEAFRSQVQLVDLIGCEDVDRVVTCIEELAPPTSSSDVASCECDGACGTSELDTARPD